jgi:hypothetical protein
MEKDLFYTLQTKLASADELLSRTKKVTNKIKELPEEVLKTLPEFSGDWSEESVKRHLKRVEEAIRNPLRQKNRSLLENAGIPIKGIPEELLDDSAGVWDIAERFSELKKFNEIIATILVKKGILLNWLREGTDKAKEELRKMLDLRQVFNHILVSESDESLRDVLIQKIIEDKRFIEHAENLISKKKFIEEFGVAVKYRENFSDFVSALDKVYNDLKTLETDYGVQRKEIQELVSQKSLSETQGILEIKIKDCDRKKSELIEQWKLYSTALRSIGHTVEEAPSELSELEKGIKRLESECVDALGEDGLKLLIFLKGQGDFPQEISIDTVKRSLNILRPLFAKCLMGQT